MQSNLEFVTDGVLEEGSVKYRLAGNEWYAVEQDDDKVMLVDTDCKMADEELETRWSDGDCRSKEGGNGQCILDYVNRFADKYFGDIKYAIIPRTVDTEIGTGSIESAYMWPMSFEEFIKHRNIGSKIVRNSGSIVWTRTFSGVYSGRGDYRYAWYVGDTSGDLGNSSNVGSLFHVAPAFYLRKSVIDHISDDGEIVLKPVKADITD